MLGSEQLVLRQAGVAALRGYATSNLPDSYIAVLNALTTFLYERSTKYRNEDLPELSAEPSISELAAHAVKRPTDLAEAFIALGQLRALYDRDGEIHHARLLSLTFSNILITHAYVGLVNLTGGTFIEANLQNVSFEQSRLKGAAFTKCIFNNLRLLHFNDWSNVRFRSCQFTHCSLQATNLENAVFEDVDFLSDTKIVGCNIGGADFTKCPSVNENWFLHCAAPTNHPPKFPAGVIVPYRRIGPEATESFNSDVRRLQYIPIWRLLPFDQWPAEARHDPASAVWSGRLDL